MAKDILKAAGLRREGVNLIACPTCGRTKIDLIPIAEEVERRLADCGKTLTVAVMGCVVNGPGSKAAAAGRRGNRRREWRGPGIPKRRGLAAQVPQDKLVDALMEEIERL